MGTGAPSTAGRGNQAEALRQEENGVSCEQLGWYNMGTWQRLCVPQMGIHSGTVSRCVTASLWLLCWKWTEVRAKARAETWVWKARLTGLVDRCSYCGSEADKPYWEPEVCYQRWLQDGSQVSGLNEHLEGWSSDPWSWNTAAGNHRLILSIMRHQCNQRLSNVVWRPLEISDSFGVLRNQNDFYDTERSLFDGTLTLLSIHDVFQRPHDMCWQYHSDNGIGACMFLDVLIFNLVIINRYKSHKISVSSVIEECQAVPRPRSLSSPCWTPRGRCLGDSWWYECGVQGRSWTWRCGLESIFTEMSHEWNHQQRKSRKRWDAGRVWRHI